MQYLKHNFSYNLTSAASCDSMAAWEIVICEINELVLDENYRPLVNDLLYKERYTGQYPSRSEASRKFLSGVWDNANIRSGFLALAADRHNNPYEATQQGVLDIRITDMTPAHALDKMVNDPESEVNRENSQIKRAKDLISKQKVRGMVVSPIDRMRKAGTVKTLAFVGLIATGIIIYSVLSKKTTNV